MDKLRQQIRDFLRFDVPETAVSMTTLETIEEQNYRRLRIEYASREGNMIPAFLLLPDGEGPFPAVLIHHQHNGQRHFGKSEVCGLVGNPLQAFGPALVQEGMAVLAPDSICFEDRRKNQVGTAPDEANDVAQHYNEMCYRLLQGDTLMRKVLSDSATGISVLQSHPLIHSDHIGIMGHSYGGNTVLFHAALDERIHFACSSGAACSYQYKMTHQIGIEMAEVIPEFSRHYDIPDLVACVAPRPLLLVSATDDMGSQDADEVVRIAQERCAVQGMPERIQHKRYQGEHDITPDRFNEIVHWLKSCAISGIL